jgi:hypothetical protein
LSGAAVTLLAGREALAQSTTASPADLHNTAPTRFQDIGDIRLAYRRFGKEGATPVVCLQHFAGTMNNSDPIHTNRLAQDRPVILVDYRGVGHSEGQTPDSVPASECLSKPLSRGRERLHEGVKFVVRQCTGHHAKPLGITSTRSPGCSG